MPTYEYKCDACGNEFEKYQSITAPAIRKCPECGKIKVKRLIGTGAGVIFKGSGFYTTDYRSDSYKNAAKSDTASGATDAAATGGEKKTDGGKASETKSTDVPKPAPVSKDSSAKPAVKTSAVKDSKPTK
jgi:putative FmdB family regulatory protein